MSRLSSPISRALGSWRALWLGAGVLILPVLLAGTRTETGFLDRSVTVDGTSYRYQVYLPSDYARSKRWPVILFLHGSGERGDDGLLQTEIGLGSALRRHPERYPAIVIFPQAPPGDRWPGMAARVAMAALDQTLRRFHADRDRVYLTGLSMGGNGVWYLAYRFPDRFAAVAPVCGWFVPTDKLPTSEPVVPSDDGPPVEAIAQRLRATPIWIFHGDDDPVVEPSDSRAIAAALQRLGAPVRYTEIPGAGHNAWDPAYGSPALPAWLLSQRRVTSASDHR
jgi:predicted peptidase